MLILIYLILAELASIVINVVMRYSGDYSKVIKNYERINDSDYSTNVEWSITLISILLGWLLFPYFVYLAIRYIKLQNTNERD